MGVIFALFSAISWGTSNALIKKAQSNTAYDTDVGTFITIFINNIINIVILMVFLLAQGHIAINVTGLWLFAVGGLLNSCIGRSFLFQCFKRIGAARGGVVKGITPLFIIAGGIFFLNEYMSILMWLGTFIILSGVYTISYDTLHQSNGDKKNIDLEDKKLLIQGILLGIVACGFLASGNLIRKVGLGYINSSIFGVTIGSFTGLLFLGGYLLIKGEKFEIYHAFKTINRDYLMGGVFTSLALYFMFFSMQLIPISVTNSVGASEPLFSILMSYWLLKNKERISAKTITGGCLIVAGSIILILFIK